MSTCSRKALPNLGGSLDVNLDRQLQIENLVKAALELAGEDRQKFLNKECHGDSELRQKVESLLHARQTSTTSHQSSLGTGSMESNPIATASWQRIEGRLPDDYSHCGFPTIAGFEILEEIGRGAMGVVYRAIDQTSGETVALKTMQRADSPTLAQFKKEFRGLANVVHPNLAKLYRLSIDERLQFFTMEYVQGRDFGSYVRGGLGPGESLPELQLMRLREALRQLAEGVVALHAAGKVHRDIKPSNILVAASGRVVLVDFGLAIDLNWDGIYQTLDGHIVGTPAFMSPEQSDGDAVTPASDWYSVGVVLYHSLSGRVPFEGKSSEILRDKHRRDPPPLAMPDVPSDIADLCADLLHRDPTLRPDGRAVLNRIGKSAPIEIPREAKSPFIGREDQLQHLRSGYQALCQRRPVAVLLSGQSGTGKSALTTEFLKGISDDRDLLVLSARCYKQENVPYKAVDGLVDALSRFLCTLSPERADAFLPQDIRALSRVFPALQQVAAVNQALQRDHFSSNQQDLRWRAFTALRELLTRLGDRKRLVMIIDDLQWGDSDSTALLNSVLRQPDGPVALFLGVFRSEDRDASESLASLVEAMPDAQQISLDSLTEEQSYRLARSLIDDEMSSADDNDEVARRIAVESSGNPFFLLELARSMVRDASPRSDGNRLTLEEVLWSRIEQLPEQSRCLLYTLSVAGQPLQFEYASVASQLDTGQTSSTLSMLRNERLIRDCGHEREALIDTYHDRVREIVIARLGEDAQTQCHRRLAESGEALPQPDVEFLALHFRLANESGRAASYYLQAADQASHKLAFNQAADFCAEALRLHEFSAARRIEVRTKMADALASGGRNVEAAQEYLALADDLEGASGLEMRRCAFTQFLLTGRLHEGMVTLQNVIEQLGLSLPSTPRLALVSLLVTRLRLWLRGSKLHLIAEDKIAPADLLRVDVLWSVAISLTRIDHIRGALFVAKGCLEALRVGEVSRIARGLALEGSHLSIPGRRTSRRSLQLIETAKNLAATF